jgi:hypothetical protein
MTEAPLDELRKALELERTRSEMTSFTRNEMGDLLLEMGNRTGALKEYRQALAIAERAVDEMPGMMQLRREPRGLLRASRLFLRLVSIQRMGPGKGVVRQGTRRLARLDQVRGIEPLQHPPRAGSRPHARRL